MVNVTSCLPVGDASRDSTRPLRAEKNDMKSNECMEKGDETISNEGR